MKYAFQNIAVVGAGAVGSFFGGMLARAGHSVTLIGRATHVEAINRHGLQIDMAGSTATESIQTKASTDLSAIQNADLILFCVKSPDSQSVAKQMAPYLAPSTVVMSLQNGVDNVDAIAKEIKQAVIPAVVYVATEIAAPGLVKHHGRGDLVIGAMNPSRLNNANQTLENIVELFAHAQVTVKISDNVMVDLWSKLMVNCAFNAISGLAQLPYGKLSVLQSVQQTQAAVVNEVIAVAKIDGVTMSAQSAMQTIAQIAKAMATQKSSTAQDMARHKLSEIDHLNGYIVRRGLELRIPTPVNQTLHALVKLVESTYPSHA